MPHPSYNCLVRQAKNILSSCNLHTVVFFQGGIYVLRIFEIFAAGYSILFAVLFESVIVSWLYGMSTGQQVNGFLLTNLSTKKEITRRLMAQRDHEVTWQLSCITTQLSAALIQPPGHSSATLSYSVR